MYFLLRYTEDKRIMCIFSFVCVEQGLYKNFDNLIAKKAECFKQFQHLFIEPYIKLPFPVYILKHFADRVF